MRLRVERAIAGGAPRPGLAVILVGDDPASEVYVRNKIRACEAAGLHSVNHRLPADVDAAELHALICAVNADANVHGVLVQTPLPPHIDPHQVLERIDPAKDVDGHHPLNIGRLAVRDPAIRSCTPKGIMRLLDETGMDYHGQNAVVVGASNHVGRPMALELLLAGCTVTVCHRFTREISRITAQADILVCAVGRSGLVGADWVKPGAAVIDVGITRGDDGKLRGDVVFDEVAGIAGWITPVPGGVGPMTVAALLENTLQAAGTPELPAP